MALSVIRCSLQSYSWQDQHKMRGPADSVLRLKSICEAQIEKSTAKSDCFSACRRPPHTLETVTVLRHQEWSVGVDKFKYVCVFLQSVKIHFFVLQTFLIWHTRTKLWGKILCPEAEKNYYVTLLLAMTM